MVTEKARQDSRIAVQCVLYHTKHRRITVKAKPPILAFSYFCNKTTTLYRSTGLEFLQEVSTLPTFKPWEVAKLGGRVSLDVAHLASQPQVRLMELLHQAAFRNTLGRSLYMSPDRIGSHTPDVLRQFVQVGGVHALCLGFKYKLKPTLL